MKLLRKMLNGFIGSTPAKRNLTIREPDAWYPADSIGGAGEIITERNVLALSAVWACVNLISGTISSLPLMIYRTNADGSRDVASDHPLYAVLHDSPNYDQTAVDFWDFIAASVELWGNGYARVDRSVGNVRALTPILPALMSVQKKQNGDLIYKWTEDGKANEATDRDILHIRGFGGNPLGGASTLFFGRRVFGLSQAAERSAGSMFENGLRPSGVLKFDKWLTDEQREVAEQKLAAKIGSGNAGKPIVLEGGTEWQQLTITPEDAQMLESRSFSIEEICRFFGVPPHMVGHTSKSTSWGSGIEAQTLGFQKFTLRRRLKRIEQALMKQLLTPADKAAGVIIEFNQEGLLRGDTVGRARFYQQMTAIGAMTINEVRALENLPPVEGGNVPRMQMQNVPITEAGEDRELTPRQTDNEE
ncbi:phage portal protein [Paenochrobactrum pullorum]|uniref:phage portal protein n=1 Tax=Paenochrobactrum pullorum TaxID=1324351 RepID=UPI0035BBD36D